MPKLADTTIRVLSQEPLAGALPTAELLRLAEILDGAGYAYLEVSGGGAFDAAVRRGVESPWERIRAIRARTKTPLMLAVRGRFLVGSRPASNDSVRRFMASAAESGIDVFRLHDPLNDAGNLRVAAEAVIAAGREFDAGLLYGSSRHDALAEAAKRLPEIGAARIVLDDPAGLMQPHRAAELVAELRALSGLPVGLYTQGAGRNGLAVAIESARAGVDLIGCAIYPVALATHRTSAESLAAALTGLGFDPEIDVDSLWKASELVDEHIGDMEITPLLPRVSVRAARRKLPPGLVSIIDGRLRAYGHGDRLDEVLDEVEKIRVEAGSPPLAAPLGQMIASQALLNVLEANRYAHIVDEIRDLVLGRFGSRPDRSTRRSRGRSSCTDRSAREGGRHRRAPRARRGPRLERGGAAPARAVRRRGRAAATGDPEPHEHRGGPRRRRSRRRPRRADPRRRADRRRDRHGGDHRRGGRRPHQRSPRRRRAGRSRGARSGDAAGSPAQAPPDSGLITVQSPMVGTFYRSSRPGATPFVEEGDPVSPGQTLCILEAMKLMNEVKAEIEAIVRGIHVADAQPVEYGQLLFELEPLNGRPVGI